MVECPKCGFDVAKPLKTGWMIGQSSKSSEMLLLTVGAYECFGCKERFRKVIGEENIDIRGVLQKIREMEGVILEAAKKRADLEQRVKSLEAEKVYLLAEIEALKVIPELETKVQVLESEVAKLRQEKQVLEEKSGRGL